jgi:hypothetical protein
MARTTFTGPVVSKNGFINEGTAGAPVGPGIVFTAVPTAALPPATPALAGAVMLVSDNGAGNNEFCLVICTGAAWVTATGQALT